VARAAPLASADRALCLGPPGRGSACHEKQILAVDAKTGKDPVEAEAGLPRLDPQAGASEIRTPALLVERRVYVGLR
jgi:hypothetical protein